MFHLYIGTEEGVAYYNLKNKTLNHFQNKGKPISNVTDILDYNIEFLIVATKNNGIFFLDKQKIIFSKIFNYSDALVNEFNPPIDKINLINKKYLFISTSGKGIFYTDLSKNKIDNILVETNSKKTGNFIRDLTYDKNDNLWILGKKGIWIVNKDDNLKYDKIKHDKNVPFYDDFPYCIYSDSKKNIWVGSQSGLYQKKINNNKFIPIFLLDNNKKQLLPPTIKINEVSNKDIYISTLNGLFKFSKKNQYPVDISKKILVSSRNNSSRKVHKKSNNLNKDLTFHKVLEGKFSWVLEDTINKNYIFNKVDKGLIIKSLESGDTSFIKFTPFINQIIKNPLKNFYWIASSEGLFKLSINKKKYNIIKKENFPFNTIRGLLQHKGNLWAATNKGIVKYDITKNKYLIFNSNDGLLTSEFNFYASFKTQKNQLLFGTINGIIKINPQKITLDTTKVCPIITSILINDIIQKEKLICDQTQATNISMLKAITQPYQNNTLSFRFAALDYTDPDANEYKYRITPNETEWVHSGTENFARYANLAPGDYTFEVDATNSDGIWSNNPAKLDITILPPWYQTWWFRTLAALSIAGIVYLIYRNRVQQIQKEADFRRKEAEYKQLAAETETAVLRLQMNPHFIFNSMNSISSYLLQKDIETANDYLGRFARLMRKILLVAEQPYLTLYEEIELLEQYMQAEAMRFEDKFLYAFEVAGDIDTDEVLIPTMILQPFVENAIWHGIAQKGKKGKINIAFQMKANKLICAIEDNGIGRQTAAKNKTAGHESKAISITQRRLNLLANEPTVTFQPSLEIIDLKDNLGQGSGTRVLLQLPLI